MRYSTPEGQPLGSLEESGLVTLSEVNGMCADSLKTEANPTGMLCLVVHDSNVRCLEQYFLILNVFARADCQTSGILEQLVVTRQNTRYSRMLFFPFHL